MSSFPAPVSPLTSTMEFDRATRRLYQFCAVDLSSFYLDVLKDRLYAEAHDGPDRRAAHFVLARLHQSLARLFAPIMPHTAEELWDLVPDRDGKPASVHLADWPEPDERFDEPNPGGVDWNFVRRVREAVFRELERLRAEKVIGPNQQAAVIPGTDVDEVYERIEKLKDQMETNFIVSEVRLTRQRTERSIGLPDAPLWFEVAKSEHPKCERCWNLRPSVGDDTEHPTLCARCVRVVRARNSATV